MESRQLRALIGLGMVGIGLIQTALFAVQNEWIPTGLGVLYSLIGVAYLWAEVYRFE